MLIPAFFSRNTGLEAESVARFESPALLCIVNPHRIKPSRNGPVSYKSTLLTTNQPINQSINQPTSHHHHPTHPSRRRVDL